MSIEEDNVADYLDYDEFDFDSMVHSSVLDNPLVDLTDDYKRFVIDHKLRLQVQHDVGSSNNLGDANTTRRIFCASDCYSDSSSSLQGVVKTRECCTYNDIPWPTIKSPCGKQLQWAPFITLQIIGAGDGGQGSVGFTASSINEIKKDRFIRVLSPQPITSSSSSYSSGSSRFSVSQTAQSITTPTILSPDTYTSSPDVIVMARGGRGGRGGRSKTHHKIRCPLDTDSYPNHNPNIANKLLSLTIVVGFGGNAGRNLYVNHEDELLNCRVAPFKHDNGGKGYTSNVTVKCLGRLPKVFTCCDDTDRYETLETQDVIVVTRSSSNGPFVQFSDIVCESSPRSSPTISAKKERQTECSSQPPLKLPLHFNLPSIRSMQDCDGRYLASSSGLKKKKKNMKSGCGRKIRYNELNDDLSGTVGGIMMGPILWHAHSNTKHNHGSEECHLSYPFPPTPFSISSSWDCTSPSSLVAPQILSHSNGDVIHTWRSIEKEFVAQMNGIIAYGGCGGGGVPSSSESSSFIPSENFDNDELCNIGMGGHGGCVPMLDPSSSLPTILPHDSFDNDTLELKNNEYLRYEPSHGSDGIVIMSWSKS